MITFWYLITYFVQTTFVFVWYTILLSYCICCANYLKISYCKFLFFHHEVKVGIWFYIVKTAVQAEMCVASCLKCGAFCSTIQVNLHPDHFPSHVYPLHQIYSQSKKCETFQLTLCTYCKLYHTQHTDHSTIERDLSRQLCVEGIRNFFQTLPFKNRPKKSKSTFTHWWKKYSSIFMPTYKQKYYWIKCEA